MSTELYADDAGRDDRRPNVSGDLSAVLDAAPMFRRSLVGYDRFQVDTYVQWAEDELATADREREHLLARHLHLQTDLDETRQRLAHSSAGGELLDVSRQIGAVLAAAADEAEGLRSEAARLRADAEATRSAATVEAARLHAEAEAALAEADAETVRMLAEAAREADAMTAQATRAAADLARQSERARVEAQAQLAALRADEERAAEQIRQQALADAEAARVHARDEVVRMLTTGREERRRADEEAAATRDRLDRVAAARTAFLIAEIEALESRRAALLDEIAQLASPAAEPGSRPEPHLRRLLEPRQWRSGSLRTH